MSDLYIGNEIIFDRDTRTVEPFQPLDIDPRNQDDIDTMFTKPISLPKFIPPRTRALLCTSKEIVIPSNVCGLIQLRSTWARLGLLSPPTIADPGFKGTLTMEIYNASNHRILISIGDAIWSILQLPIMAGTEPIYKGRYQGQTGIQIPKALDKFIG
jgi:dCTP deaminase